MDQAYTCYCKNKGHSPSTSPVVEDACRDAREAAQLRLAKIQNGKHEDYKNGTPKRRS